MVLRQLEDLSEIYPIKYNVVLAYLPVQKYENENLTTNTWYLDYDALRSAWEAFCATWNEGMGTKPTWEQWLAWFEGSQNNPYEWSDGSSSSFYTYLPVGNILPLLLFAVVYVVILFLKRNKTVQL